MALDEIVVGDAESAVYSFPDLKRPVTLAVFAPIDVQDAQAELERHIQALARGIFPTMP